MLDQSTALDMVRQELWPALTTERDRLNRIDKWARWEHDRPAVPRQATAEYRRLAESARTPWLRLVVNSRVQQLYIDGYRRKDATTEAPAWTAWQANRMDARQVPLHRATFTYGLAYETVLPGRSPAGQPMPVMRGVSPRRMIAMYEDEGADEWPVIALQADPAKVDGEKGWLLQLYDDEVVHRILTDSTVGRLTYVTHDVHGTGVCPVVRFTAQLDLEGRADGEVEPYIPIARRINQTTYDRLVVQRFASWVVRTISGMTEPEGTAEERAARRLELSIEDILIAEDPDTKFGSLPATSPDGYIAATEHEIHTLSATSQTPAHEMLGQMANLSAEALAAAEASLTRAITEAQYGLGESHEQSLRLAALGMGDTAGASDTEAQVRWRDMESRSLATAADALGKLAQMLNVPVELLWEKIPGWTQQDVETAKEMAAKGDAIGSLTDLLNRQMGGTPAPSAPGTGGSNSGG